MWPMYMADWIRLAVIMEHGGIWLDASSIVTGSFDYLMERQEENGSEGFAYHLGDFTKDPANPVIESWFVASIPNGRFISAWFNEFNKCLGNFRMNDLYLDHLKRQYGEDGYAAILQNLQLESYLKIHVTCMKVITMDGAPHPYSEAAEEGPLKLLWMTGFNDWGQWEEPIPPFFKLRGGARWAMIRTLDPTAEEYKETHEESIYARFVRGRLEMMKATELRVEGMSEDMMAILHKREVRKAREVKEEVELVKKRDDALGEFFKERMKGREFTINNKSTKVL
ncbi:hypothetical protein BC829DRAFT_394537 [Chytridium lagenaria]|nr:hypothetical protein BC829DRAFT_394537 [Chytridium lagenaria]